MQWLRRLSQTIFLLLFAWVVLAAAFAADNAAKGYLETFFHFDPLIALATFLATYELAAGFLLALVTVAVTLVLGRVFCGWVCPLGAVHTFVSWLKPRPAPGTPPERRSAWQRGKYVLLVALLVMAVAGVHWAGVVDPLSLLYRAGATVVLPALQFAVSDGYRSVYQANPEVGGFELVTLLDPPYEFLRDQVFRIEGQAFAGAFVIGLLFAAIVALNLVRQRWWCRYVCPLGGLLGLFAQRPALRLHNDASTCNDCGRCNLACPAQAQPDVRGEWLPTECYACWNCVAACNFGSIRFQFEKPWTRPNAGALDLNRRAVLTAGAAGVAGALLWRVSPQAQATAINPALIRPPGARPERDFLQRCIQCGLCMRVCPTNALHPATFDGGVEGLWTPKLIAKIGYCEYDCTLCGQVCPTGAIEELTRDVKQDTSIGLAQFDPGRCLPYAYNRDCAVCEEHCPVPDKAIYFVPTEVTGRDGATLTVNQPRIDPDKCIGCGVCEWSCVFDDQPAVYVTSANESRNPDNQPILPGLGGGGYGDYGGYGG